MESNNAEIVYQLDRIASALERTAPTRGNLCIVRKTKYPQTCAACGYEWMARIEKPRCCPSCRIRQPTDDNNRSARLKK